MTTPIDLKPLSNDKLPLSEHPDVFLQKMKGAMPKRVRIPAKLNSKLNSIT